MKKNYRWGILGAGRIADKFCEALTFTEGSSVYAIASRDKDKAAAYAQKFNAAKVYNSYEELVKDADVDIVYIATPHVFHFGQTMLCIQNNKPVLCEKPLSLSPADTAAMIAAAKEKDLFFMEGMWTICMPFIQKIQEIISDGILGDVKYITADFSFGVPNDPEGRLMNKALGGGSVLDVGVYPVFLAAFFLGEPTIIRTVSKLALTGVDEYASILLQYEGNQTAHLFCGIGFQTSIEAEITGTKGRIKIKNPWFKATDFSLQLNDGTTTDFAIPHQSNGFEHEIKEVMYCLDNKLLQSPKVPHQLSQCVSNIMETVLQQAGVFYQK